MSKVAPSLPPAPEGQQGPPAFAAARCKALRVVRGSLPLTSGTASRGERPSIAIDDESWQQGYASGLAGAPSRGVNAAVVRDRLSWISGWIEGDAARLRRAAAATVKLDGIGEH